jgi:hypothetical protein
MFSRLVYCVLKFVATNGREFDALWHVYQDGRQKRCNRFAHTLPTQRFLRIFGNVYKILKLLGERAGDRTQDPVIKSHVLYRLSYALAQGRCVGGDRVRVNRTQAA